MPRRHLFFGVGIVLVLLCGPVYGGGPRTVTNGHAVKWTSMPITVHLETDLTVRGKDISSLIDQAMNEWVDLGESDVVFTKASLDSDVDNSEGSSNVCNYLYDSSACQSGPQEDGKNPLVIDEDGEITASFFGSSNNLTTLGFASIISYNKQTGAAVKGEAVFNASCLTDVRIEECVTKKLSFSDDDFVSFIVHELGHFLGLDHSQVNLTEATDDDDTNDDLITTMFPTFILGNGGNFKTPERDDAVGLAELYPSSTFEDATWGIAGTIFSEDGTTGLQCANVVARNQADPKLDAISAISGDFSTPKTNDGTYEILGLTPGATYTLEVEPIAAGFTGASGYTPCRGSGDESSPPQFASKTFGSTFTDAAGGAMTGANLMVEAAATGNSAVGQGSGGCSLIP